MKAKSFSSILFMICLLMACQPSAPASPAPAALNTEVTLAPGESVAVTGTDLTITFHSVVRDERCPREVECAASGPVTVSLAFQQAAGEPTDFTLQTFTDLDGRSPNVQFEGVTNRTEVGNYRIHLAGVTPYPIDSTTKIEPSEYRIYLLISNK